MGEEKKKKKRRKRRLVVVAQTSDHDTTTEESEEVQDMEQEQLDELVYEAENIPDSDERLQEAFVYFRKEIGKYDLLTPEEERKLAILKEQGDGEARDRLIFSNLRLVVAVVNRVMAQMGNSSILNFMDLVQEGVIGLITAVDRFDPKYKTRFSTYGVPWIYQQVKIAILKHRRGFAVPGFTGVALSQMRDYIEKYKQGEEVPEQYLRRVQSLAHLTSAPIPLCEASGDEESGPCLSLSWFNAEEDDENLDMQVDRIVMCERCLALLEEILTPDELDILKRRFGIDPYVFPHMLEDIARAYSRSVEYIRKRLDSIIRRLRWHPQLRQYYKQYMIDEEA
jgi:RNA polymerase primary sigma factor